MGQPQFSVLLHRAGGHQGYSHPTFPFFAGLLPIHRLALRTASSCNSNSRIFVLTVQWNWSIRSGFHPKPWHQTDVVGMKAVLSHLLVLKNLQRSTEDFQCLQQAQINSYVEIFLISYSWLEWLLFSDIKHLDLRSLSWFPLQLVLTSRSASAKAHFQPKEPSSEPVPCTGPDDIRSSFGAKDMPTCTRLLPPALDFM